MDNLTSFERRVLLGSIRGVSAEADILRGQVDAAKVIDRKRSGVGFNTQLIVGAAAPRLAIAKRFRFGNVVASSPGLAFGAGFLVTVANGALCALEGYSFGEAWPESVADLELSNSEKLESFDAVIRRLSV